MTSFTPSLRFLTLLILSVAGGLFSTGCKSVGESGSGSFAAVTIAGQSRERIRDTTVTVFREHGYRPVLSGATWVFDKGGIRTNTISPEGFIAAPAGGQTVVRVRAEVVALETGSSRLQCQAYVVTGAGNSFFEEERRLANVRRRPYQRILDEIAKRLKQK